MKLATKIVILSTLLTSSFAGAAEANLDNSNSCNQAIRAVRSAIILNYIKGQATALIDLNKSLPENVKKNAANRDPILSKKMTGDFYAKGTTINSLHEYEFGVNRSLISIHLFNDINEPDTILVSYESGLSIGEFTSGNLFDLAKKSMNICRGLELSKSDLEEFNTIRPADLIETPVKSNIVSQK